MKTKLHQCSDTGSDGGQLPSLPPKTASRLAQWGRCSLLVGVVWVSSAFAAPDTTPPRVLVLGATVDSGANAQEVVIAQGFGFTVDVVSDAVWAGMTATTGAPYNSAKGFSAYRAIILADRSFVTSPTPALNAALANRTVWSAAAAGNVIIDGEDFTYHANYGSTAGIKAASKTFITNAVQFATADPTKTGLFIQLSGYYNSAGAGTLVPVLDALSSVANQTGPLPNGPFAVRGGDFNKIHLTATHAALAGLTDANLSNYGCSSHETFDTWPKDFIPLAIATDSSPIYSGGIPVMKGSPYIMVRGVGVTALGDNCLSITNQSVDCISTNSTYAWNFCVTNRFSGPIGFLSFPDLPAGMMIDHDILRLNPVLQSGQGTCLTLYITNTLGPTNLCFTIGAHSTNFFQCCSISNCLAFAPCCAYVVTQATAPISGPPPNCYNYYLKIKNVSQEIVSYFYFTPDPFNNCLTFTPDMIHLVPPLQPNQTSLLLGPIKVCIDPLCPKPLCFLLSLHTSNLVQCCSTRHCFPPPINPPIALASPADGSLFLTPANIPLTVNLSGDITFSSVVYRANDQVVASNSVPPFSAIWSNAVAGDYVLNADGFETNGGGVWTSDPVTIYVRPPDHDGTNAPPAPAQMLTSLTCVGNSLSFCLSTTAGVTYDVEYSDTLSSPRWTVLQTIVGDGSTITVTNAINAAPQRFFRVRME